MLMSLLQELGSSASDYNFDCELFSLVLDKALSSSFAQDGELLKELVKNEKVEEMIFQNILGGFYSTETNSALVKACIGSRRAPFLNSLVASDRLHSFFFQVLLEPGKIITKLAGANLAMDFLEQAQAAFVKKEFSPFSGSNLSRFL
mmetsp:Transcript_30542/g.46817  ORF Transcript_30542/g.46817 Transcript_30542/m.46817 type:complete len:147 (-) Transcript_30542:1661-2101(-)